MFRVLSVDSLTIICPRPTLCDNLRHTGGYGGRDGETGETGDAGDAGDAGDFLSRKSPTPPQRTLLKGLVGEDIILPKTIPLRKKTGDTGDTGNTGNFLGRKFPEPFKELAERLWK